MIPVTELSRKIAEERGSSIFIVEIKQTGEKKIDVQAHGSFDNRTTSKVNILTGLVFALREFAEMYQVELEAHGGEVKQPKTELSELSAKAHGISHVIYDPLSIMECVRAALAISLRNNQRRVTLLGVAGLIVHMQASLAGDTFENTVEVMRLFLENMLRDPKINPSARA